MSAVAAISGFVVWIAILSFPLAIYFLVILARRGREVQRERWADLRPVKDLDKPLDSPEKSPEKSKVLSVQSDVTPPKELPTKDFPKKTG
jgi:hypothetical protein